MKMDVILSRVLDNIEIVPIVEPEKYALHQHYGIAAWKQFVTANIGFVIKHNQQAAKRFIDQHQMNVMTQLISFFGTRDGSPLFHMLRSMCLMNAAGTNDDHAIKRCVEFLDGFTSISNGTNTQTIYDKIMDVEVYVPIHMVSVLKNGTEEGAKFRCGDENDIATLKSCMSMVMLNFELGNVLMNAFISAENEIRLQIDSVSRSTRKSR